MARPKIHSFTWSDTENRTAAHGPSSATGPLDLKDKELQVWVTYPDAKSGHGGKKKARKNHGKDLRLWAVIVVESVEQQEEFTYQVCLRRVFKTGERFVTVQVTNDPQDQSEDASVFGFLQPPSNKLDPFERHLCLMAAKRVYDAIADTWTDSEEALAPLAATSG